jgi:glycolate oxidase FAD binding subunit
MSVSGAGSTLRSVLERELGTGALAGGEAGPIEIEPAEPDALAAALRVMGEAGGRARVRGRGTWDGLGNLAPDVDVVLSTRGLYGVTELDTQDGVALVRAGTTLDDLVRTVAPHGWEVPLGAPPEGSVGGALAVAAIGPRRLGQGPPRDCVLGLEVALATGERTRCGGRVVKNVTGFDLAKLYTGSFGCLGVIESAWLRLRPRPESVAGCVAPLRGGADDLALAIEAARRPTARCAALVDPERARAIGLETESAVLLVELAGSGPGVQGDLAWLSSRASASTVDPEAIDALGRSLVEPPPPGGARARLAMLPSSCVRAVRALRESGARLVVHAGLGIVHADWDAAAEAVDAAARIAIAVGAEARFEHLPDEHKRGRDVFGVGADRRAVVARMRALKRRFDPAGVLNPGRFLGHV